MTEAEDPSVDRRAALTALYHRHHQMVASLAFRCQGHAHELDDIVQEVFLDAYLSYERIRDLNRAGSWLATVTVRKVHRRIRHRYRASKLERELVETSIRACHDEARTQDLVRALGNLHPDLRIAWTLRHVEGMTIPEISQRLDWSDSTTKRRLERACKRLERIQNAHNKRNARNA